MVGDSTLGNFTGESWTIHRDGYSDGRFVIDGGEANGWCPEIPMQGVERQRKGNIILPVVSKQPRAACKRFTTLLLIYHCVGRYISGSQKGLTVATKMGLAPLPWHASTVGNLTVGECTTFRFTISLPAFELLK